jgi:hypothetical protein
MHFECVHVFLMFSLFKKSMHGTITSLKQITCLLLLVMSILCVEQSHAQDVQAWLDGFVYKSFGKKWEYEGNVGVNKLLQKQGWGDIYLCNTFSWQGAWWYSAEGSLELHYTNDQQNADIVEVRPWLAQKFIFAQYVKALRVDKPYMYMRLDQRFLFYPEQDTSDVKTRLRVRFGGRVLLNDTKLTAGTFYIPFFFENFFNFNGEAIERYATRNRTVVGLGYMFNSKWRTEFDHYIQRSRNSIEGEIVKTDIMLQLKVLYFLD